MASPVKVGFVCAASGAAISGLGAIILFLLMTWMMRMKAIPKATYQTPEQLADRIRNRELEAALLPPGFARQSVLIEVAKLRAYADVKRCLATPEW
jgi:hypothetical protein